MSMIFRLRMIGTEDEEFLRDYELPYSMSLLDFHRFICEDLEYDQMSMSSFFLSNERWEKGLEFTLMDMGGIETEDSPIPMENVLLGQVFRQNKDRLIYIFDPFGDRGLFLELTGTLKRQEGLKYPRIAKSQGDAPLQFESEPDMGSVFSEAMDDFFGFEGDDFYDDDF